MVSLLSKVADKTKLEGKVGIAEKMDAHIQESLDIFIDWAKDLQIRFNVKKCKNNENWDCIMQG